jgi:hypothetical protein
MGPHIFKEERTGRATARFFCAMLQFFDTGRADDRYVVAHGIGS